MSELSTSLLTQHFGFTEFKPGQQEVVDHLLEGKSAAAVFPTGGGKSLCYQLPALTLPGLTLVVSPLIALMKDQIDALAQRGISAIRLDSTLDIDQYRDAVNRIRRGEVRLLYLAPERFNNERFRSMIARQRVSLFAVDEAHCISEWGHNFRPDYLKLAGFAKEARAERILALTATATTKVLEDICRVFEIAPDCAVRTGFYRPNLTLLLTPVDESSRDLKLHKQLRDRPRGPTIVYVTLQRTAEQVADYLASSGFAAKAYHAGMQNEDRTAVQDWFIRSSDGVVVATIAFGMGIDKADIRYVYHYNLPKSLENYSQEIGRAGRDGKPATCEVLACADDLGALENFVYGDTPTHNAVRGLVQDIFSQGDAFDLNINEISNDHDLRMLVTRTLLTYLELLGHLEGGTPFYSIYRFKPKMSSAEMLAQFDDNRRAFLSTMFTFSRKARTWFDIDVDHASRQMRTSRDRLIAALDYLNDRQMLEVKAADVRHRYRVVNRPDDLDALAEELYERTLRREQNEISRLNQVVDLIEANHCQVAALAEYFGETRESCGHCSWCLRQGKPARMKQRAEVEIHSSILSQLAALRQQHPTELANPRVAARLLCGIATPWLSKSKLTRDPLFGRLDAAPFKQVLEQIESMS